MGIGRVSKGVRTNGPSAALYNRCYTGMFPVGDTSCRTLIAVCVCVRVCVCAVCACARVRACVCVCPLTYR